MVEETASWRKDLAPVAIKMRLGEKKNRTKASEGIVDISEDESQASNQSTLHYNCYHLHFVKCGITANGGYSRFYKYRW